MLSAFLSKMPRSWGPYLRLGRYDKPIGSYLVFLPACWGLAAAIPTGIPDPHWIVLYGAASCMIRAAGCSVNDMWDKDFDSRVERCKTRPLASGELSRSQALKFFAASLSPMYVGFCIVNPLARDLLLASIPLIVMYPLAKRYTYWPQAVLGLCMNYSCLVAYAHFASSFDPLVAVPLYIGGWAWTMIYDSIYAYQDVKDDILVGVKSTALLWKDDIKLYCGGLTVFAAASWTLAGVSAGWGIPYYFGLSAAVSHLTYTWATTDINNPANCSQKFTQSKYTGIFLLLAIIAAKQQKDTTKSEKVIESS